MRNAGRLRSVCAVRLEEMIRQHIKTSCPPNSMGSIPRQMGVSHSIVWDALRVNIHQPYGSQKVQGIWRKYIFKTQFSQAYISFNVPLRLLASHLGELGSIPSGVAPGFSHVGIVSDNDTGRRVSSGTYPFPRRFVPALLRTPLTSPFIGSQDLDDNSSAAAVLSCHRVVKNKDVRRPLEPQTPAAHNSEIASPANKTFERRSPISGWEPTRQSTAQPIGNLSQHQTNGPTAKHPLTILLSSQLNGACLKNCRPVTTLGENNNLASERIREILVALHTMKLSLVWAAFKAVYKKGLLTPEVEFRSYRRCFDFLVPRLQGFVAITRIPIKYRNKATQRCCVAVERAWMNVIDVSNGKCDSMGENVGIQCPVLKLRGGINGRSPRKPTDQLLNPLDL
ncbi:hypothetical protein PR048_006604 [Dryococelus australis]|uniref:Maturase n=1 Tax=Dryococelus australis TaxID=614101 RepID=A0ABQ9IBG6_9NEOP|nr:hypothetical protein PR048_006604 [Dryococelus australis]